MEPLDLDLPALLAGDLVLDQSPRRVAHQHPPRLAVGVKVSPYEGTKHAFATDLKRRGVDDRVIQSILGHADRRSVERYARLEDQAVVTALRPRQTQPER